MSRIRRAAIMLGVIAALSSVARAAEIKADIVDYFNQYYVRQVVRASDAGALEFLRDAAAAHKSPEQVLKSPTALWAIVDQRNGYLQINGNTATDQVLTMAFYGKADGTRLIVVGSSDCADACIFEVGFFTPAGDHLDPVPRDNVVPAIGAAQFIKPGHPMPKALAGVEPKINYVPARIGTTLTLKPWYGYEAEEQMDAATRSAIQNVTLRWDRNRGVFVAAARQ